MWSVLENVYYAALGWNVPYALKSIWSNVLFKINVSSLIFWLDDLSIDVSGALNSPISVLLSISPFKSVNNFSTYQGPTMSVVYLLLHPRVGLIFINRCFIIYIYILYQSPCSKSFLFDEVHLSTSFSFPFI